MVKIYVILVVSHKEIPMKYHTTSESHVVNQTMM